MISADVRTNELGHALTFCTKIGTGGHGDTMAVYNKKYKRVKSMVSEVFERKNTGKRNDKGNIIYDISYHKVDRLLDVNGLRSISPSMYDDFISLNHVTGSTKVICSDLVNIDFDDSDIGNSNTRIGIVITHGDFVTVTPFRTYEPGILKTAYSLGAGDIEGHLGCMRCGKYLKLIEYKND